MPCLLMTRARADSERFLSQLDPVMLAGWIPVFSPLIDIRSIGTAPDMSDVGGVIFTSSNGVRAADALGISARVPCYCVGPRTTQQAKAAGWQATQAGADAAGLIATLEKMRPGGPFVHLCGTHTRGDIAIQLTSLGLKTRECTIYKQRLCLLNAAAQAALAGDQPVIVPLFSPRTARQFADHAQAEAPLYLAAMSKPVADEVKHMKHIKLLVAQTPDSPAMARCVASLAQLVCRVEGRGEPK